MKNKTNFTNSLSDALTCFWTNYVGWGRATRAEYWWVQLFYMFLISFILGMLLIPGLIWSLIILIPNVCLTVRRLHDTGRSGYWFLWSVLSGWLFLVCCVLLYLNATSLNIVLGLISLIIMLIFKITVLVFLIQKGDAKANKYGTPRI